MRAYRATAEQLKQYEAAREALQSKANDPSATLSVEMCEEMTALSERVTEFRERLGDAHAELDKLWQTAEERGRLYKRMAQKLGLSADESHIACFGKSRCKELLELLRKQEIW